MNKTLLIIALMIAGSFLFCGVQEAQAGTIFMRSVVAYDSQAQTVGGISATYVTYDIYDYYDPGVYGELYYLNPTQYLDNDGGIGVNDYLFYYYPGYRVSFTTNNYRPNKTLCTLSEHGLRAVYTPGTLQYYDPYRLGLINAGSYGAEYDLPAENKHIGSSPESDYYSSGDYYVVGFTFVCIQTPTASSVGFETINSAVTNDNPGGGWRIFPDRQTLAQNEPNRRIVRVKAQLTNPVQGVRVYFRNYDVDDPSNDTTYIDPNGNAGDDNRGERDVNGNWTPQSAGTLSAPYADTGPDGIASVEFTVTIQPGDNFVVAASTDPNFQNGIVQSGMLTVWRRLHVEVDSMGAVQQNFVQGNIASGVRNTTSSRITLTLNVSQLEQNRFENGLLVIGTSSYRVIASDPTATPPADANTGNTVTIINDSGNFSVRPGTQFILYDDDDYNDNDGPPPIGDDTLDGDTGEDVEEKPAKTFSLMRNSSSITENAYAAAYIQPEYNWAAAQGYNQSNINFSFNLNYDTDNQGEIQLLYSFLESHRDSREEYDDFWSAYVFLVYQPAEIRDNDPITERERGGDTLAVPGNADSPPPGPFPVGGEHSLVYLETCRDADKENGTPEYETSTAAHEVGHQMGLDGDDPGFGIMSTGETLVFVPTHINMLRTRVHSPGN